MSNTEELRAAAQAVLDRWDSPQWEWIRQGPTADLMHALRAALAQPAETDAELQHRTGEPHIDGWPLYSGLPPAASGEPVAWYVKRVAPGKRDDGMRLGPWWVRTQAEGWADDRHVLCALYATAQPAPAPAELLQQKFNEGRQFEQERQAAIHAQPAPALVPPGWVLVPVEPTPEMRQAAVKVICYGPEGGFTRISGPDRCWHAMLASAPYAPQSHPQR